MLNEKMFFNVICEERDEYLGGKTIHIDTNRGSLEEVCELFRDNILKFPNAHWELHPHTTTITIN